VGRELGPLESESEAAFRRDEDGTPDLGMYGDYAGASMTAYAFDRVTPGLGKWLVPIAAWLFALSTMISWSYYGEQGVYYFFGNHGEKARPRRCSSTRSSTRC
jgi:Na+/alanine symporter